MSGGYFNYASVSVDFETMLSRLGSLRDLRHALAEYPDSAAAVAQTDAFIAEAEREQERRLRADERMEAWARDMEPVWKAVEWCASCDYSRKAVEDALRAHGTQRADGADDRLCG